MSIFNFNSEIQNIFRGFSVNNTPIPVSLLRYEGHGEPYVTYMQYDMDASLSGDDSLIGCVVYYDFDIYSKSNYLDIIDAVVGKMQDNGWVWQVSRSSEDMFEDDTGYFHKTLCFAKESEV